MIKNTIINTKNNKKSNSRTNKHKQNNYKMIQNSAVNNKIIKK